jgi:hypothetical protein
MNPLANYYGIWSGLTTEAREIEFILENLQEGNFPFSHGCQAYPNDFHYLSVDNRKTTFGIHINELPPYIFEKNLQPNRPKVETKQPQGFFEKLFTPPPSPKIEKFLEQDSNILLGANTIEELIELVKQCRFEIEDVDEIFEHIDSLLLYQAIYNDHVIRTSDIWDIEISLSELGATLDNIRIESPTIKSISPEKQTVVINGESVKLYPFIFQTKIVPDSPIFYGAQKPYWLVLGAKNEEDLRELVESLGINFTERINTTEEKQNYQRKLIPNEVQLFVWKRDNGKCVECGGKEKLEFDHIIPVSKGGSNTARNIQLLCENCNRKKYNNIGQ